MRRACLLAEGTEERIGEDESGKEREEGMRGQVISCRTHSGKWEGEEEAEDGDVAVPACPR